ncbi:MAG: hypothetical protein MUE50_20155 [Pirellulaceae bacterium]|nr:hypothetical protein [Pirellulaceae bacterium]
MRTDFLYREVLERDFGWLDNVVRAKKPKHLPVVFTPEEAMGVIGELRGRRWLMGMQLYGGGLGLSPRDLGRGLMTES